VHRITGAPLFVNRSVYIDTPRFAAFSPLTRSMASSAFIAFWVYGGCFHVGVSVRFQGFGPLPVLFGI
jgi:hypothetical protein